MQVKKIDYILALSGRRTLHRAEAAITNRGLGNTSWSLCQTTHPYHRHRLIVVNMEVKKQHGVDPLVQLGIWTAAGFIKRRRDGDMRNSPIMPGLTIVGHDWELYLGHTDSAVDEVVSFIYSSIFSLAQIGRAHV